MCCYQVLAEKKGLYAKGIHADFFATLGDDGPGLSKVQNCVAERKRGRGVLMIYWRSEHHHRGKHWYFSRHGDGWQAIAYKSIANSD